MGSLSKIVSRHEGAAGRRIERLDVDINDETFRTSEDGFYFALLMTYDQGRVMRINRGYYDRYGNFKLHCVEGPASETMDLVRGLLISQSYSLRGMLHREGGLPAVVKYRRGSAVVDELRWYRYGQQVRTVRGGV